jgi:solute carrier family 45 protein 1/2/4
MLISSLLGTYIFVCISGISLAVTIWAPFSMISIAIKDNSVEDERETKCLEADGTEKPLGIVMSMHNVAIASPQIVAGMCSSLIFHFCNIDQNDEGSSNGMAWKLRTAALPIITAAVLTMGTR